MLSFVLIATALALVATAVMARPLLFGRRSAAGQDASDIQVFRDQLAEVDRDLARGTLSEGEADGARTEVSRRLIAANKRAEASGSLSPAPAGLSGMVAGLALIGTPVLAAVLYMAVGTPGLPGAPLADRSDLSAIGQPGRPTQEEAEIDLADRVPPPPVIEDRENFITMVERLEGIVAERPEDIQGQRHLTNALAMLGRWKDAYQAQERYIALAGDSATSEDHSNLAELMMTAAGGYISPRAEEAIKEALRLDDQSPMALYLAALTFRQSGRPEVAVGILEDLLSAAPDQADWREAVAATLAETRAEAGQVANSAPGPTAEDVEAAQDMTAEERTAMIASMIAGLEERLTTEGGDVEEWARLITAYQRFGQPDEALRAYGLAVAAQTEPSAKGFLKEQALLLGMDVE